MKNIVEIINEAAVKKTKLKGEPVVKGQEILVRDIYDPKKGTNVFYLKPHENDKYFYALDVNGKLLEIKIDNILKICPFIPQPKTPTPRKKQEGPRSLSWSQRMKLNDELNELRHKYNELMWQQEEQASDVYQQWIDDGNDEEGAVDAPNYDKEWKAMWKEIEKISAKISKIEDKLNNNL